ncbi:MAG: aspartate-semialdehyde dehydrogenase [Candidatus Eremiobacteraeota bacterium]|nr:aspartate-semialdehyde dehydrogenase [Candidatus Eremiobacteraeota bacterium]
MKVALVGATGIVGETVLRVLEERHIPIDSLGAFASRDRKAAVRFRGETLDVLETTAPALEGYDTVFFAGSEEASGAYAPRIAERGNVVIDNSATYRLQAELALLVPEVNADALRADQRIFPVANCTAIVLCVALAPVRGVAGLRSVQVATYQSVSGAGRAGIEELAAAEAAVLAATAEPEPKAFAAPIARNVIPQIGTLGPDGYTTEETKVRAETRKILDLDALAMSVIAVRVPVRYAHSEAVFFETTRPTTLDALRAEFGRAAGIAFHAEGIVTPREVEGQDLVHVARLRAEDASGSRFSMWISGDQVRKGAATNGVQILELLLLRGLVHAS